MTRSKHKDGLALCTDGNLCGVLNNNMTNVSAERLGRALHWDTCVGAVWHCIHATDHAATAAKGVRFVPRCTFFSG